MTNPFLAPDRVPPPATRNLLPGTAKPYYPGDPVPNSPAATAPPGTHAPGLPPTPSTYAPQPAATAPPGGWNGAPQPIPNGSSSYNGVPGTIRTASTFGPTPPQGQIQVQQDQYGLRFAGTSSSQPFNEQTPYSTTQAADPPVLPTLPQHIAPHPNQLASYSVPWKQVEQRRSDVLPSSQVSDPREVRIRAITSPDANAEIGRPLTRDGFRPQGSSQVRKPTLANRLLPRKSTLPSQLSSDREFSHRFGFDPQFDWLRGELVFTAATGQWALRYTANEARDPGVDQPHGGSMRILNPQVLGSLQPGDYVVLRGRIDQLPNDGTPVYNVSVVQRQRI